MTRSDIAVVRALGGHRIEICDLGQLEELTAGDERLNKCKRVNENGK